MMEIQTRVSSILKEKFAELFQRFDTYWESLIDIKTRHAKHEWDESELQEVQQYIASFKPCNVQNRVPGSQHKHIRPASVISGRCRYSR